MEHLSTLIDSLAKLLIAAGVFYNIWQGRQIHTLVNGSHHELKTDLDKANNRIESLSNVLMEKTIDAASANSK